MYFAGNLLTGILAYSSEAGVAILMGLGAGALLHQWGSMTGSQQVLHLSAFPEDVFFFYLLPPIILNAGFQLHPARFMKYLAPILILGLAGTLLSSIFIGFGGNSVFQRRNMLSLPQHLESLLPVMQRFFFYTHM